MSFRDVLKKESIIIAPGAYDVVSAQIIEKAGFPVCYITGLGNEASDLGCPDLGLTNSVEIIRKAANIAQVVDVPVVCDADTGFGGVTNLVRTVKMFEAAGVGGIHIEDQTFPKRCGLLAGKKVITAEAFAKKIQAAIAARNSEEFVIIARTDAKALGIDEVIRRLNLYVDSGADMGMLGDGYTFDEYTRIAKEVKAPIVRNPPPTFGWTGFGTFGTHSVRSWAGYPLKNAMTTSCFPKFAKTPCDVSVSEHTSATGWKIMPQKSTANSTQSQ